MFLINKIKRYKLVKLWRKRNKHNLTGIINNFNLDLVEVGKATYGGLEVYAFNNENKLYIGNYCSIGPKTTFLLSVDHRLDFVSTYPFKAKFFNGQDAVSKGDIVVDDDVWFGYGATILSGVHIGQGAVIAAGAIVTKDVPPYAIVGGSPAKIIKYRFEQEIIQKLVQLDYAKLSKEIIRDNQDLFYQKMDTEVANKMIKLFGKKVGK